MKACMLKVAKVLPLHKSHFEIRGHFRGQKMRLFYLGVKYLFYEWKFGGEVKNEV